MKYVLTGAPGSGKSSILTALEFKGYDVIPEAAEDYIQLQQARGIKEPWDSDLFQENIFTLQQIRERKIRDKPTFIDRGTLDGLAYYQVAQQQPSKKMQEELVRIEREKPYDKIFLIRAFGLPRKTSIRRENYDQAIRLELQQLHNYQAVGYEPISIPAGTVDERVTKILQHCSPS